VRSFLFEKLSLLSFKEKAGLEVTFDPQLTVFLGANRVGKSSILKSLYWALGAEPVQVHKRWIDANVVAKLDFSVDGTSYSIVRHKKRFGLFDEFGGLLITTSKVTSELGPALAKILGFELRLTDANGVTQIPPPAFAFLPYYVDQDRGWIQPWQSFDKLGQFPNHRQDAIFYHSGIRSNEFYRLRAEQTEKRIARSAVIEQRKVVEGALSRFEEQRDLVPIEFDPKAYQDILVRLIEEADRLEEHRHARNVVLGELASNRRMLVEQITIAKAALGEFEKDYAYLIKSIDEDVICPTCGTEHENSFAHRFSLVEDREACRDFLLSANAKLDDLNRQIEIKTTELGRSDARIERIQKALEEKRGDFALADIISSEGDKRAAEFLHRDIAQLAGEIATLDHDIDELTRKLAEMNDKNRKAAIQDFYFEKMTAFLRALRVDSLSASEVEQIDTKIRDTGSDQPRAVLSYVLAFAWTATEFSPSTLCPLVLDSPIQQDQDPPNAKAILRLIFDKQPPGVQVILASVSRHNEQHSGKEITFDREYHLLSKEKFHEIGKGIQPYFDQII